MKTLKKILVAGPAMEASLAAMFLKRGNAALDVELLVTSTDADPIGECTTPFVLQQITGTLGIRSADLHRIAKPNWTLGFKMNWGSREHFVRAFDGAPTGQAEGLTTRNGFLAHEEGFDEFSLGAALITAGKLFPKDRQNSVKLTENITGLVLRPEPFADLLQQGCKSLQTPRHEGSISEVRTDGGNVTAVVLDDGKELTADLYVDVTGPEAKLLNALGSSEFQPQGTEGLCNRAWTVTRRRANEAVRSFSTIDTVESGWRWRLEHDDTIGFGLAYHSDFTSDEEALADLQEVVRTPIDEPRLQQWNNGHQSAPWSGNVMAIGDSAAFLEPLSAVRLPLLILHLNAFQRITAEIPAGPGEQGKALYHRMIHEPWQELRDFTSIHHQFNTTSDSPYWQHARKTCGAGAHESLLALFMSGGPEPILQNAMPFSPCSLGYDTWLTALIGLGIPIENPPQIPSNDSQLWRKYLEAIRGMASKAAPSEACLTAIRKQSSPPAKRTSIY